MPRMKLPPTRSNLLRIRKDLRLAREGYEIASRADGVVVIRPKEMA